MEELKNKKLIVMEGLDGSGKKTQAKLLVDSLNNSGKKAVGISFPDYASSASSFVKEHLNAGLGSGNVYAVSSFFAIDRYVSFVNNWKKNYENGDFIIADRYTTSNAIYQLTKLRRPYREKYLNWLFDYEYEKLRLPKPNLVIFLSVPVKVSQELMLKRYNGDNSKKDLYESDVLYLKRCEKIARYFAGMNGWFFIDCIDSLTKKIKPVDVIKNTIFNIVKNKF